MHYHTLVFHCTFTHSFHILGLSCWLNSKESICQCRRHEFDPWVGKIPWGRKWQPIPVFLPQKSHGQRSLVSLWHAVTKSQTQLSDWTTNNHSPHWGKKLPLWSAHSRWLFSCSLYIPCWTSTCFILILCTWLTFLCICLSPQLVIVLIKGVVRGHAPLLVSLVTNEPSWNQFPHSW